MTDEFQQEDEILGKAYDARLMARVLRYLRPYWKLLAVSFVFLMLQTARSSSPYITKVPRPLHCDERSRRPGPHGAGLCRGRAARLHRAVHPNLHDAVHGQRAMHDLRMDIFRTCKMDMAYFDRNAVAADDPTITTWKR